MPSDKRLPDAEEVGLGGTEESHEKINKKIVINAGDKIRTILLSCHRSLPAAGLFPMAAGFAVEHKTAAAGHNSIIGHDSVPGERAKGRFVRRAQRNKPT